MGLFKPYDSQGASPVESTGKQTVVVTASEASGHSGSAKAPTKKAVPTPTRRQAEQARRDRIQPVLSSKQAKTKERQAKYKARDEAMAKTHAQPYNVMARDWVDGRWNLAEFILPVMVLFFVLTIAGSYVWPPMMEIAPWVIWGVFALLILDVLWMWFGLRKQLRLHFPGEPLKGKLNYALSRSMAMRRSRTPAPRVKRGTKFVWPNPSDQR